MMRYSNLEVLLRTFFDTRSQISCPSFTFRSPLTRKRTSEYSGARLSGSSRTHAFGLRGCPLDALRDLLRHGAYRHQRRSGKG